MKTLSDLKKDAKSGAMYVELISKYGSDNIPEMQKGKRKVINSNTVSIKILKNDGKESSLDLPFASLVEYTGEKLTIYAPGLRDLNTEEKNALAEWEKITGTEKYQKQMQDDAYTDGTSTFYQERAFFSNKKMLYLMGCYSENGLHYESKENKIRDKAVKGEMILQYNVYIN